MVWSQALEVCEGTTHMRLLGIEALLWGMDTHATASDVRHARTSDWADWADGQKEIGRVAEGVCRRVRLQSYVRMQRRLPSNRLLINEPSTQL